MEITEERSIPETVSIVALGQSKQIFIHETIRTGTPRGVADEVWTINKLGPCLKHDLLFRMDDLREFYPINRHKFIDQRGEKVKVHDAFLDFLKNHDKPIITSKAYPEFPMSIEFPLQEVVNSVGTDYIRTTPAYAIAFAIHIGVKKIRLYGLDYSYPNDRHTAEAGRANVEFLIAIALHRGIDVWVPHTSTLLDKNLISNKNFNQFYGYRDHIDCEVKEGKFNLVFDAEKADKIRKNKIDREKLTLQNLMTKYREDVKKDLIVGKWITREDFDKYDVQETTILKPLSEIDEDQWPIKNIDLPGFPQPPDAPEGAGQEDSHKGDIPCQVQHDIQRE